MMVDFSYVATLDRFGKLTLLFDPHPTSVPDASTHGTNKNALTPSYKQHAHADESATAPAGSGPDVSKSKSKSKSSRHHDRDRERKHKHARVYYIPRVPADVLTSSWAADQERRSVEAKKRILQLRRESSSENEAKAADDSIVLVQKPEPTVGIRSGTTSPPALVESSALGFGSDKEEVSFDVWTD